MGKYDDIIDTVYPPENKRSELTTSDRAAQFASFKALGDLDEIEENALKQNEDENK